MKTIFGKQGSTRGTTISVVSVLLGVVLGVSAGISYLSATYVLATLAGVFVAVLMVSPRPLEGLLKCRVSLGDWVVGLQAGAVLIAAVLARLVDGVVQRVDDTGARYLQTSGNFGRDIGLVLLASAIVVALLTAIRLRSESELGLEFGWVCLALLAWWLLCSSIFREGQEKSSDLAYSAIALLLGLAVILSPPTRKSLIAVVHIVNATTAVGLLYGLLEPASQLPCRLDKCGFFGTLMSGVFFQENAAARIVVSVLVIAWIVPSRWYYVLTIALSSVFVLGTGSRTSFLALGVAIGLSIYLRWKFEESSSVSSRTLTFFSALPILALGSSVYLFAVASASELTDRGAIYEGIRSLLNPSNIFTGVNSAAVGRIRINGGYAPSGEHGEAPHLIVQAGVVGLLIFSIACAFLIAKRNFSPERATAVGIVSVVSMEFVTEAALELNARSISFTALLLAMGLTVKGPGSPSVESFTVSPTGGKRSGVMAP